jgi:DNA-binding XRE family transcriptional regulator
LNPNVVAQNCSGQLIREHREAAGFTQSRLAKSIGLGRDAVAKIESGARCVTDWELLEFARALQTSPNSLLGLGRHAD